MSYRLQATDAYERLYEFLQRQQFPCENWTLELLSDHCLAFVVLNGEYLAGFVWFMFDQDTGIEVHACIEPQHRGCWLTNRVRDDVLTVGRLNGAEYLAVVPAGADSRRVCCWAARRLGGEILDGSVRVDLTRGV